MTVYLIIEMADIELIGVQVFQTKTDAEAKFNAMCEENHETPWHDVNGEIDGTLAAAGDDAYSIQLVEREAVQP